MGRIEKLCAYLDCCELFIDVGCDHGYCTEYMLKKNLCERAIISDISSKSLEKAKVLLKDYIDCGRVAYVVADGLDGIDDSVDEALIAGVGGETITEILKKGFIPKKFVLQPMHGVRGVREFLVDSGAKIIVDEPFFYGGKYYFVIKGERDGGTVYSEANYEYGLSLNGDCTRDYINDVLIKFKGYMRSDMSACSRAEMQEKVKFAEGVLLGEIK